MNICTWTHLCVLFAILITNVGIIFPTDNVKLWATNLTEASSRKNSWKIKQWPQSSHTPSSWHSRWQVSHPGDKPQLTLHHHHLISVFHLFLMEWQTGYQALNLFSQYVNSYIFMCGVSSLRFCLSFSLHWGICPLYLILSESHHCCQEQWHEGPITQT